ncbi:response regulator transcription factor [Tannockella kyphosi]|uniref:response regulator transcription factor n=1 Tax=Tannockella kyphosi TaxID=2899121 RepID=UPI002011C3BE|nr:response regulator transcription factor [Tannockella kyphosi]
MKRILLVEDDKEIVDVLQYILEKEYVVDIAFNKQQALMLINKNHDLTILDITLPDGNSLEFSHLINNPIIYLTAKDDEETILQGLTLGEEYIIKPFKKNELLLRIEKVLKRTTTNMFQYKDILIDSNAMKVYVDNKEISFTLLDYKIVELLFIHAGKTISRDSLATLIYNNTSNFVEDNTINVYIKRVRDKLNRDYIKTIKRVGYLVEKE